MLSGGLDSTSIASTINRLLREEVEEAASVNGIQKAFSACYPNFWNDETEGIDTLAADLDIEVEKVFPVDEDVGARFSDVVRAVGEPFGGSMPFVQDLLMRRARSEGVTVTLNGHGPDEMFGGYPARHCSILAAGYLGRLQLGPWRREVSAMRRYHNVGYADLVYTLLFVFFPAAGTWARSLFRYPKRRFFRKQLFGDYDRGSSRSMDRATGGRTALDRRLRREFFSEIVPPTLTFEDRASMSASVESRVPFLDHRIVEFAFGLDDADKIYDGFTKSVLRKAMRDHLPASIVDETRKRYFDGPVVPWMRGTLRSTVERLLLQGDSFVDEYLEPDEARGLTRRLLDGERCDGWEIDFVWRTLMTEAWFRLIASEDAP
jgi:asparagine synthase (glutamine-hydrolysing)